MPTYKRLTPKNSLQEAMFNFSVYGNDVFSFYILVDGPVYFSVSDNFSAESHPEVLAEFYSDFPEQLWSPEEIGTIREAFQTIQNFVDIEFIYAGDFDKTDDLNVVTPADIEQSGLNINVSSIWNTDIDWLGISNINDSSLYPGSEGDVFLNLARLREYVNYSAFSFTNQVLLHEILHSLGLSHPHSYKFGQHFTLTEYRTLIEENRSLFDSLGFGQLAIADFDSEIFTLMSYKLENQTDNLFEFNAYTPMLLDVLALHSVYGAGAGTHGENDDEIVAGNVGYRTYFDTGGTDTINVSIYTGGAIVKMGEQSGLSDYLIGAIFNRSDWTPLITAGVIPTAIRWLIGNIENLIGSPGNDFVTDNHLDNDIKLSGGSDTLSLVNGGEDVADGGEGLDAVIFPIDIRDASISKIDDSYVITGNNFSATLKNFEIYSFSGPPGYRFFAELDSVISSKNNGLPGVKRTSKAADNPNQIIIEFNENPILEDGFAALYAGSSLIHEFTSFDSAISTSTNTLNLDLSRFTKFGGNFRLEFNSGKITDFDGNRIFISDILLAVEETPFVQEGY